MSDEIQYVTGIRAAKGVIAVQFGMDGIERADWNGDTYISNVIDLTTTLRQFPLGDLTEVGMGWLRNLGEEDVEIRNTNTGNGLILVKAGEKQGPVRFGPAWQDFWGRTVSGTSQLKYAFFED